MVCQWVNVLAPYERCAAALHAASAAAGLGGLLDGQPDFLAKRHLQGMAVGIADEGHIPDGRTSISRAVEEPPFTTSQRAQPLHFLPTLACHAQVGGRYERMVDLARKTLRLPRCLRRGGMSVFGSGLDVRCQRQVEGVQWRHGSPTHTPRRLRYPLPLGLVAQVSTQCIAGRDTTTGPGTLC